MKNPPPSDVLEVSLFGSGYGESVVVHLGDGEWIIVDSCVEKRDEGSFQSSPIAYLNEIGVDFACGVSHVFATHWHSDHIAGLSKVVDCCESADFCCSAAFRDQEFHSFATVYADAKLPKRARATEEVTQIMRLLNARKKRPKLLISDTLVHKTSRDIKVFALSPSNERVNSFLSRIASKVPELDADRKATVEMKPNEVSVVLLIDLVDDSILLGADLEENPGNGWSAIVNECKSVKGKRSSAYKVAHHGSQTGDCADIWEKLLLPNPFAILTPFNRGRKPIPSKEDVDRVLKRTPNAYSSARLGSAGTTRRRKASVEKILFKTGNEILPIHAEQGHVRLRRRIGDAQSGWLVELQGGSVRLEDVWA